MLYIPTKLQKKFFRGAGRKGLIVIKKLTSLSTMNAQSECSRVVCVVRIELYGSTTALAKCGAG